MQIEKGDDVEKHFEELTLVWRPYMYARPTASRLEVINAARQYTTPVVSLPCSDAIFPRRFLTTSRL